MKFTWKIVKFLIEQKFSGNILDVQSKGACFRISCHNDFVFCEREAGVQMSGNNSKIFVHAIGGRRNCMLNVIFSLKYCGT